MSYDLKSLNPVQLDAVYCTQGAVLVTAGAGSGKTRLLTHRIARLIEHEGIKPYNILAITFTNKAANEMRERLEGMEIDTDGLWVFTFHAMCVRILRRFAPSLGYTKDFTIYGEAEKTSLIKRLCKDGGYEDDFYKTVLSKISYLKNEGLSPDVYASAFAYEPDVKVIAGVYAKYEAVLKKCNAMDYDDLLLRALELLNKDVTAREFYQDKFRYIHVDEFQDTNQIQYNIVKILAYKHKNIFVVGDEDQCIYSWRGANIQNIFDFEKDFNCKVFKLEQNYRSTKNILNLANSLIKNNKTRLDKKLWTDSSDGCRVTVYTAQTEGYEADFVLKSILNLVDNGYRYGDIAVLMRLNALTRSFEERFIQYGIPHKVFGGFKFFERKEIKDILAYLRLIVNPFDDDALVRVINFPRRGIGEASVSQLINYCTVSGSSAFNALNDTDAFPAALSKKFTALYTVLNDFIRLSRECSPYKLTEYIISTLGIDGLYSDDSEESRSKLGNIKELLNSVYSFCQANDGATLSDYIQSVMLYTDIDGYNDKDNAVTLATVHSAKGLEFKAVFIIGLEEGIFPVRRVSETSSLEEERRLMYVAITRAKERLYLTHCQSRFIYGERKSCAPSCFLRETGLIETPKPRETTQSSYSLPKPMLTKSEEKQKIELNTGDRVLHRTFGEGVVMKVNCEGTARYAEIKFEKAGTLMLSIDYAPITKIGSE